MDWSLRYTACVQWSDFELINGKGRARHGDGMEVKRRREFCKLFGTIPAFMNQYRWLNGWPSIIMHAASPISFLIRSNPYFSRVGQPLFFPSEQPSLLTILPSWGLVWSYHPFSILHLSPFFFLITMFWYPKKIYMHIFIIFFIKFYNFV